MRTGLALAALTAMAVATPLSAQDDQAAWAVAVRLVEQLGGVERWASARALYVREEAYPSSLPGAVTAEFWRDLRVPAYRSRVVGSGVDRESVWSERAGWSVVDGVRTQMSADELAEEISGWAQEPYVMYGRLARRDAALRLSLVGPRRLEVFDRDSGRLLCWFVVGRSGAPVRWGNHFAGEINEHVYGPLRAFGALRMPRWGTSTTGSWRFEYREVRILDDPIDVSRPGPPGER